MQTGAPWEGILVAALVVLLIFLFRPGIKNIFERSRQAESDWGGLLIPIGGVVLFVILLIMLARG